MRCLIVSDIHGNLPALEAVLAAPQARGCTRVFSLGDHTGFGPQPRQVQQRLSTLDAVLLEGNHESRLHRLDEPEFSGYNWAPLRWTAEQLAGLPTSFPRDFRLGDVLMTHGTPGDPFHLIGEKEVPGVLAALPQGCRFLLSGHNHTPWCITSQGRTAVNPGSLGMREDGVGGRAPFAVLTVDEGPTRVETFQVAYSLAAVRRAYVESGCAAIAPEISRAAYLTMAEGRPLYVLQLLTHARRVASALGLTLGDRAAWAEADRTWPWPEAVSSPAYWAEGGAAV